ncbi:disulfide bond formation protein B [Moraxella sp. FZLJ2107]|uniref:disulfide bond formation protein B n=1 Tax=unclassified Moraxella TaxID=2685852 RepID=UPI0020C8B5FA|nr:MULTISPECIES: disulfide bond formation protein B [unclassified Moraxella]UTO04297.1 disulfide bond formation protein B [Moraxella sp. FZLJ2107]UTO23130.1 disulfide bond formation protein B [Moraxella sp. FZLJ2109]
MKTLSYRILNAFVALASLVVSIFVIAYLQHYLYLDPCPLCIFQRIGLWISGLFAFLAALFNPKGKTVRLILWLCGTLGALWGFGVAARHTWIHYFPSQELVECGPGLNYMVETMPMGDVFSKVLFAKGDCTIIDWAVFGLSIPAQALILFSIILVIQVVLLNKILKDKS